MSTKFYRALGQTETWPNLTNLYPSSLTYDDVLLVPQMSTIKSRHDIDTSIKFGPYKLKVPVMSAPMDTVTGEKMIRKLAELGGIGTLPRDNSEGNIALCKALTKEKIPCVYSIGLKNALENAKRLVQAGAKIILIDVAHGGMVQILDTAKQIKAMGVTVIAGNIATYAAASAYEKSGVIDYCRVGIGPGGLCTTRLITGHGFPQLSALFDTSAAGLPILADGGINRPGDVAKAIAAGASMVMIGSMFAATDESPGDIVDGQKLVRGQASESYMKSNGIKAHTPEGISTLIKLKGPVEPIFKEIEGGLRSAMSYSGATNIVEFQKKAIFIPISNATFYENRAHITNN